MAQMTVQIVTPDGLVFDHHATFVSVKTLDGEMGILLSLQTLLNVLAISTSVVPKEQNCVLSVLLKKHRKSI